MKKPHYKIILGSVIAFIGLMLSPLTWWNDMLVNLPLSFGFAWVLGRMLSFVIPINIYSFLILMAIGYFLTNVIGLMLMHKGVRMCRVKKQYSFNWKKNLLYAFLAFVVVLLTIQIGLLDLGDTRQLMASILKVSYLQ